MAEVTLDGVVRRVELLEQKLTELSRTLPARSAIQPGAGDWDAAARAAAELRAGGGFDFDALREQDEQDRRAAGEQRP